MSRHRDVRNLDYADYDESDYGSSYPDSVGELSRSMEREFIFNRDEGTKIGEYFVDPAPNNDSMDDDGEPMHVEDELEALIANKERNLPQEDRKRLHETLEQILDVVGLDTIPESRIKEYILKCDFDKTLTLNTLLNNPPTVHSEVARARRTIAQTAAPLKVCRIAITEEEQLPSTSTNAPAPNTQAQQQKKTSYMRKNNVDVKSLLKNAPQNNLNLIVTGHVDSGKSTLIGHLLVKLGVVSKKVHHKYETESKKAGKSSFSYAWVLDETSEERSRGITMTCGSVAFSTSKRSSINILDAPGHKDFIPNMISGSVQADAAILVVNAATGEFEVGLEGQTREHAVLLRSLGVSPLIVAVNKLDTVDWDEKRFNDIRYKMDVFLKQIGYTDVSYVPVSGLSGDHLIEPSERLSKWSVKSFPTLLEKIDEIASPTRLLEKPFRMSISDVFKSEQSSGISIAGRIESGFVLKDDKVLICPIGELSTVKTLPSNAALAGDFITLNLSGVNGESISPGMILADPKAPIPSTKKFRGRIIVFDTSIPLIKGSSLIIHAGNNALQANLSKLISLIDKSSGQVIKKNPRCLPKNSNALVEISLESPICLELYSDIKDLGRFMLRSGGKTLAAGLVMEIL